MKSATWLYNAKAALKRKAWFTALVSIILLFSLTINAALQTQDLLRRAEWNAAELERLSRIFSYNNAAVSVPLLIAAFAAAVAFFGYLHQGRQSDFYHSLPISRPKLFFAHFAAGAAAVLLPWLANLLLTLAIMAALGAGSYLDAGLLCSGLGGHLLCFFAVYTLTALAMVLTGHRLVGGLLALVFLGYAPLALSLASSLWGKFYPTWYSQLIDWDSLLAHSSPAARYISLMSGNYRYVLLTPADIYGLLALIAAGICLCLFFYGRRPAEAAGRALAFPVSRIVIKYPLVMLAMAGMSLTLYEIGNSSWTWYMIGAVLGGFISSQMLEIINAFDFRAIRARLLPFLITLGLFCGGSLLGINDVTGYNDYVPEPEEVARVEIVFPDLDIGNDYLLYGYVYNDPAAGAALRYLAGSEEEILQRGLVMGREGVAAAVGIAGKLVQAGKAAEQETDWNRSRTTAYLRYTLQDGTVKTRAYRGVSVYTADIAEELDAIYAEEQFRQGLYPLFDYPAEQAALVGYTVYEDYSDGYVRLISDVDAPPQDIAALLDIYREELTGLIARDLREQVPLGMLEFRVYATRPTQAEVNGSAPGREFDYPVYPAMTGTLAALARLEQGAIAPESWLPRYEEAVEAVYFTNLDQYQDAEKLIYSGKYPAATAESYPAAYGDEGERITDPARLRQLIDESHPSGSQGSVFHDQDGSRQLLVTYRNRYGETYTQNRWFDAPDR